MKIFFERTESGIPVIVDNSSKDTAVFMTAVGTGSRDEDERIGGISHLLEHVVFRATKTRSSFQMSKEIEVAGGELNAFTSKEMTAFYSATIRETSDVAKEMVADVFMNPLLLPADTELEKKIVLQEISMWENDPESYIHSILAETLWNGHPLANNEAGRSEVVAKMTSDDLMEYYKERYVRPNIAVFAAGAVNPDETVKWVNETFDKMNEGRKITRSKPGTIRPEYKAVQRKGDHVYTGIGFRSYPADHKDISALTVLNAILGSGMSSRLFQNVREEKALVYSVYSTVEQNSDAGSLAVYMSSTEENVMEAMNTAISTIRKFKEEGMTDGEMQRAKNLIKGATARQLESTSMKVYRMARKFMLTGVAEPMEKSIEKINAVSEEDIMRVASDVLRNNNLALAIYGPKNKELKNVKIDQFDLN